MLFSIIPDAVVILRSKGVFRQVKAYERKGFIYAQYGGGFIRLTKTGTSVPTVKIDQFDLGFEPKYNHVEYMVKADHPEAK